MTGASAFLCALVSVDKNQTVPATLASTTNTAATRQMGLASQRCGRVLPGVSS